MWEQLEVERGLAIEREERATATRQDVDKMKVETLTLRKQIEEVISKPQAKYMKLAHDDEVVQELRSWCREEVMANLETVTQLVTKCEELEKSIQFLPEKKR